MRLTVFISIVSLWLSTPAFCREIRATSGEHADFSRIVLFFEDQSGWRFDRTSDGYFLEYEGEEASLDTSEVFKFIPKTRVLAVEHEGSEKIIRFSVECECHADAFEIQNGHVAIDFKDGVVLESKEAQDFNAVTVEAALSKSNTVLPIASDLTSADSTQSNHLQNFLISSLANAMNEGLLQPATPNLITARPNEQHEEDSFENIIIDSSSQQSDMIKEDEREDHCIGGERYAFPDEPEGFINRISNARRKLFNGNFVAERSEFEDLGRYYISAGLGAEALALLDDDRLGIPHDLKIRTISRLLDSVDIDGATEFEHSIGCGNALALWSLIIGIDPLDIPDLSQKAILQTLAGMSESLRNTIAPMVLANTSSQSSPRFRSEIIHLLDWGNSLEVASQNSELSNLSEIELEKLRRENSEWGDSATLELAKRYVASNVAVNATFLRDLESRAIELRNEPVGDLFASNYMRLAATNGEIFEAIGLLERMNAEQRDVDRETSDSIITALVEISDDESFVINSIRFRQLFTEIEISRTLSQRMVRRLASIGVTSLASEVAYSLIDNEKDRAQLLSEVLMLEAHELEAVAVVAELNSSAIYPLVVDPAIGAVVTEDIRDQAAGNLVDEDARRVLWHLSDDQLSEGGSESRYSNRVAMLHINSIANDLQGEINEFGTLNEFSEVALFSNRQIDSVKSLLDQFSISE